MTQAVISDGLPQKLQALLKGKTQEQLAEEIGIDQSLLSRLLSGERRPGPKAARAIVARFPKLKRAVADALLETA